ncbi:MAG: IS200/IS605 family transposase [Acidobacteriota bacterium]
MPQSLARLLVHVIFSTKYRAPLLVPEVRSAVHQYLGTVLRDHDCPTIRIGGVEDHVHLFFGLSRTLSIAKAVEIIKTSSSKWIKLQRPDLAEFHWQNGYGAFSVSPSQMESVIRYIENQEAHHREVSFQDEMRGLLHRHGVEYDERYAWD